MAIQTGNRVNFVAVEGKTLPSKTEDSTIYFLKGAQELYVGTNLISNVLNPEFVGTDVGFHNSIHRGKYLGTEVTTEQYAAIQAGTFDDLFIGDYWRINGVNWRIAAFDYYYQTGDTACTTHHVVIVPDTQLYTAQYHVTASGAYESGSGANVTTGGYVGSDLYTGNSSGGFDTTNHKGLYDEEKGALGIIIRAFGSEHILEHRQYLVNAVSAGHPSAGAWYDSRVELMTEENVYGCKIFGPMANGSTVYTNYTIDKSQFPLFALDPSRISSNRQWYWLRDVVSATYFAIVDACGHADYSYASFAAGVRPAFSLIG